MFPLLWVIATLFHLISSAEIAITWALGGRFYPIDQSCVFLCCIVYLLGWSMPKVRRIFPVILLLEIAGTLWTMPIIPNHRMLMTFLNIGLLFDLLRNRGEISADGESLCRSGTITLYAFAAFHKLNSSYLDPTLSCASDFVSSIQLYYPLIHFPQKMLVIFPFLGVCVEFFIVIALFLGGKLRIFGVLVGVIFHLFLALDQERHFFDFSSTMFALLFLFLPERDENARVFSFPFRILLAIGFIITFILMLHYPDSAMSYAYLSSRMRVWWLFAFLFILALRGWTIDDPKGETERAALQLFPKGIGLKLLSVLLLLNGMGPYLGIKTRSAFDMFSNLSVEGGKTNHLVYPDWLLGDIYTTDLVTPVASSGQAIRGELLDFNRRMVRFELASLLSRTPNLAVTLQEGDTQKTYRTAEELYPNGRAPNWFLRKILGFRPVEKEGEPQRCQW